MEAEVHSRKTDLSHFESNGNVGRGRDDKSSFNASGSDGGNPLLTPTYLNDGNTEVETESYCVLCETAHSLTGCANFLALSPEERTILCRNRNLCFKCTQAGHTARACKSRVKCIVCGGPHHAALHSEASPSTATPAAPIETA